jgi:hypothetical protein
MNTPKRETTMTFSYAASTSYRQFGESNNELVPVKFRHFAVLPHELPQQQTTILSWGLGNE